MGLQCSVLSKGGLSALSALKEEKKILPPFLSAFLSPFSPHFPVLSSVPKPEAAREL